MFKFLLILSIIVYLIFKVGGFFFKAGAASQQYRQNQSRPSRDPQQHPPQKDRKAGNIKGGEYIDYEEIK